MAIDTDLKALHDKSRLNRPWLAASLVCGCFYCLQVFRFDQIVEWVENGETALCPYCGIDSVLGFDTKQADNDLLQRMHDKWFGQTISPTAEEWKTARETNAWPDRLAKPAKAK